MVSQEHVSPAAPETAPPDGDSHVLGGQPTNVPAGETEIDAAAEATTVAPASAENPAASPIAGEKPVDQAHEAEAHTPQPEKVFGQEAMSPDDVKAASREISKLLTDQDPKTKVESRFKALQALVELKRANIELAPNKRAAAFRELTALRGEAQKHAEASLAGKAELASTLTRLKYLGAIEGADAAEKELLAQGILEASSGDENQLSMLSKLCLTGKYVGVPVSTKSVQPYLEKDIASRVGKPGQETEVAYRIARAQHIGVDSTGMQKYVKQNQQPLAERLSAYRTTGRLHHLAKLQEIVNLQTENHEINEVDQTALVSFVAKGRALYQAGKRPITSLWNYVATITKLSKRMEQSRTAKQEPTFFETLKQDEGVATTTTEEFFRSIGGKNKKLNEQQAFMQKLAEDPTIKSPLEFLQSLEENDTPNSSLDEAPRKAA